MRIKKGEGYWRGHVERWSGSGLTQSAYCRQHGVEAKSFSRWCGKLGKREDQQTELTMVPVRREAWAETGSLRLTSPGGWRIELEGLPPVSLGEVLRWLP